MSGPLRSLCYYSRSLVEGCAAAKAAELDRLLLVAREVNARHGVTGMLLYSEDCFAQLLEGTPQAVGEIYAAIERDRRHTGILLLHDTGTAARSFAAWSMAAVVDLTPPRRSGARPMGLFDMLAGNSAQPVQ